MPLPFTFICAVWLMTAALSLTPTLEDSV